MNILVRSLLIFPIGIRKYLFFVKDWNEYYIDNGEEYILEEDNGDGIFGFLNRLLMHFVTDDIHNGEITVKEFNKKPLKYNTNLKGVYIKNIFGGKFYIHNFSKYLREKDINDLDYDSDEHYYIKGAKPFGY